MILVIDNYDSFTYNLVDMVKKHQETQVFRNDEIDLPRISELNPDGILISPGPGRPKDSGISVNVVNQFQGQIPILGICLGHQIMGEILGMNVQHAHRPMHGRTSFIQHAQEGLFANIPNPMRVMRYHSLIVTPEEVPSEIKITAKTQEGEIMGLSHDKLKLNGVQFHPESILTENGNILIKNWIEMIWS
ncbi:MAG: aminodeoxychorismate/anthranilate synthase component II [Bacteroidia bacterium]|nr:aminodeoxychorismate/anthranilate synthase component II [Bacteroidia bacterium]